MGSNKGGPEVLQHQPAQAMANEVPMTRKVLTVATPATQDDPTPRECAHCRFWRQDQDDPIGQCRHNPPKFIKENFWAEWPHTEATDWCGHWKRTPGATS